jgi:hypothetical protein
VKGIVRTDAHALAAADAAAEKILLGQGARRTHQERIGLGLEGVAGTEEGYGAYSPCHRSQDLPASDVHLRRAGGILTGVGLGREETEMEGSVGAGGLAIQAKVALGLVPTLSDDGIIAPLAVQQAFVASPTGFLVLLQAEDGEPGEHPQQGPKGTDSSAPEAGIDPVQKKDGGKERPDEKDAVVVRLPER